MVAAAAVVPGVVAWSGAGEWDMQLQQTRGEGAWGGGGVERWGVEHVVPERKQQRQRQPRCRRRRSSSVLRGWARGCTGCAAAVAEHSRWNRCRALRD